MIILITKIEMLWSIFIGFIIGRIGGNKSIVGRSRQTTMATSLVAGSIMSRETSYVRVALSSQKVENYPESNKEAST